MKLMFIMLDIRLSGMRIHVRGLCRVSDGVSSEHVLAHGGLLLDGPRVGLDVGHRVGEGVLGRVDGQFGRVVVGRAVDADPGVEGCTVGDGHGAGEHEGNDLELRVG